jgi:hypothetical protein
VTELPEPGSGEAVDIADRRRGRGVARSLGNMLMRVFGDNVPATLALTGTLTLAAVQVATHDDPAPAQTCDALVERMAEVATKYPDLVDVYVRTGGKGLPTLADADARARCGGDPVTLLRELSKARGASHAP